jgi:type I restriction enzyme S subunit
VKKADPVALSKVIRKLESGSRPKGGIIEGVGDVLSLGGEHLDEWGSFDLSNRRFVPRDFYERMKRGIVKPRDILIVKDGATTGKVSYVSDSFAHFPCCINEHVFRLAVNSAVADSRYVFYHLFSEQGHREILADFRGATVGGISQEFAKKVTLPLPPLPEQQRIAAILARADRLRRLRRYALDLGDSYLQSVFLQMFGDCLESDYPTTPLGKLVTITGGGTPSRDVARYYEGTIPWLTSKDMRGDYIVDTQEHVTEEAIRNSATKLVPAGSILIVVKSKILMHRLPIAIGKRALCHGQDVKSIQCSERVDPLFIVHILKHNEARILAQARGANTEGLTLPMLQGVSVPDVPLTRQQQFARIVHQFERLRAQQREAQRQAEHLFQTLLHRAFQGEL